MTKALLDTNVLVHAAYRGSALYPAAAALVERGLREPGVYCISPQNIIELCAVATRARFVNPPLAPADLQRIAGKLYGSRRLSKIYPVRGTVARAVREGVALGITGPRWYDLFLAATMQDAGIHIVVTDNVTDFARIPFITAVAIEDAA
jgi:predicted nucleic acid-binding protein